MSGAVCWMTNKEGTAKGQRQENWEQLFKKGKGTNKKKDLRAGNPGGFS